MVTIEKLFEGFLDEFDLSALIDPETELFEGAYSSPLIYKYCASTRRDFFARPQMRFTQREVLNDPFEMSQRWQHASTEGLRRYLHASLQVSLPKAVTNTDFLIEKAREYISEQGIVISDSQSRQLEQIFTSEPAKLFVSSQLPALQAMTNFAVDYVCTQMETEFQQLVENMICKWGVLSLTEDPLNHQVWAHYASEGAGFVVGLDAHHALFLAKDEQKNLRRKVRYTDERTENFWRNPYYLFLVKSAGWAYEREWRVLKDLSEPDDRKELNGQAICLWNLPPEAIKTIYFGYGYNASHIASDIFNLTRCGASPDFYSIRVNRGSSLLEPHLLSQ